MSTQKKTTFAGTLIMALLAVICLSWYTPAANQLANTKWKGTLFAPNAIEGILDFKTDTFKIILGSQIIETMSYQTKGDTLVIKKLSGGSPCSGQFGQYKYSVKGNVLNFAVIRDDCDARPPSFSPDGYTKQ